MCPQALRETESTETLSLTIPESLVKFGFHISELCTPKKLPGKCQILQMARESKKGQNEVDESTNPKLVKIHHFAFISIIELNE